jgi:hypothetical protein
MVPTMRMQVHLEYYEEQCIQFTDQKREKVTKNHRSTYAVSSLQEHIKMAANIPPEAPPIPYVLQLGYNEIQAGISEEDS